MLCMSNKVYQSIVQEQVYFPQLSFHGKVESFNGIKSSEPHDHYFSCNDPGNLSDVNVAISATTIHDMNDM